MLPLVLPEVVQRYRARLEHQRIQNALSERESQLHLLTDALPVGISYVDIEQCYRSANRTCKPGRPVTDRSVWQAYRGSLG